MITRAAVGAGEAGSSPPYSPVGDSIIRTGFARATPLQAMAVPYEDANPEALRAYGWENDAYFASIAYDRAITICRWCRELLKWNIGKRSVFCSKRCEKAFEAYRQTFSRRT